MAGHLRMHRSAPLHNGCPHCHNRSGGLVRNKLQERWAILEHVEQVRREANNVRGHCRPVWS